MGGTGFTAKGLSLWARTHCTLILKAYWSDRLETESKLLDSEASDWLSNKASKIQAMLHILTEWFSVPCSENMFMCYSFR